MFLFKRRGIYYLEYFDELENRKKRISTKSRLKPDALKFLTDFKKKLSDTSKVKFISLKEFEAEYCKYIERTRSRSYLADVKTTFKTLIALTDDVVSKKK
jgi:hypothetical protein